MKHFNSFLTLAIFITLHSNIYGQTNVNGGIYTNTTWTTAGNPYIVIADVAVFSGAILTIQPGVVIKFDNNQKLLIKPGAQLIAEGTLKDSITFTSNSVSLKNGLWKGIYSQGNNSKFDYCTIKYSEFGIKQNATDLPIKHSTFSYNSNGVGGGGTFDYCVFTKNTFGVYGARKISNSRIVKNQNGILGACTVFNCVIDSNSTYGINYDNGGVDTIANCKIRYNGLGIIIKYGTITITKNYIENNTIGLQLEQNPYPQVIICNKLCGNQQYDLKFQNTLNPVNVASNHWCTTDSTTIATHIYDGYDDINYQLVTFLPIDKEDCYFTTGVTNYKIHKSEFQLYPNPSFNNLTVLLPENNSTAEIKIFNSNSQLVYFSKAVDQKTEITVSSLKTGFYLIQVVTDKDVSMKKFIKD